MIKSNSAILVGHCSACSANYKSIFELISILTWYFADFYCRVTASVKNKAAASARLKKHRERIYSNPELLEEYRRKERERSGVRKVIKQGLSFVAVIACLFSCSETYWLLYTDHFLIHPFIHSLTHSLNICCGII